MVDFRSEFNMSIQITEKCSDNPKKAFHFTK